MAESLKGSFRMMVTRPGRFFRGRPYLAVASVYSATYVTANIVMTWTEKAKIQEASAYKLAATSTVNVLAGVTKDSMFAIWFGVAGATVSPLSFPLASWSMFVFRDVMTIGAGFIFPQLLGASLHEKKIFESRAAADTLAQLSVPMVAQLVLTPIHLYALDIYNRPGESVPSRLASIRQLYNQSTAVRVGRVASIYGIAGVGNKFFRTRCREMLGDGEIYTEPQPVR